jgi:hypothetical protein
MKLSKSWKHAILLTTLVFAQAALAETPAEETEKKCIKPKFRDFSPAHKAEVAPETEISFHVNRYADPLHIGASAKKIPMQVQIEDKQTFYYVTAKLPKELRDSYARIHIEAKSTEGDCVGVDGWLVKINEQAKETPNAEAKEESKQELSATTDDN